MKIAVLMTCFNRSVKTLECLENLFNNKISEDIYFEVFLVDDGSTDGTSEAIEKDFPSVNIIQGTGSLFWNRGMRLAWGKAAKNDFDFYIWLNDDVTLYPDSFSVIFRDYENVEKNSIISGVFESENGTVTYSGYKHKGKRLKPNGNPQRCDYFNGNFVLIPKSVFESVGNLDPIFSHAQGDFDYGLRAKKKGINSYITSRFTGKCKRHDNYPKWCDPKLDFVERLKSFKGPLGGRPYSTFIFEKRHYSYTMALFHYFTIHLRLLFPTYWVKKRKAKI